MTITQALKQLKELEKKLARLNKKDQEGSVYRVAMGEDEEKLRPEYEIKRYREDITKTIKEIAELRHKINVFNCTYEMDDKGTTPDKALSIIPGLKKYLERLDDMCERSPRQRVDDYVMARSGIVDYEVTNYKQEDAEEIRRATWQTLTELQEMLDRTNTTIDINKD